MATPDEWRADEEFLKELRRMTESGELKQKMSRYRRRTSRPGKHTGARVKR